MLIKKSAINDTFANLLNQNPACKEKHTVVSNFLLNDFEVVSLDS